MKPKTVQVQKRHEGEIIPEGVSCTETSIAWHIAIRVFKQENLEVIARIRVRKNDFRISSEVTILDDRPSNK